MGQIKLFQRPEGRKTALLYIEERAAESRRQEGCAASEKKKQKCINYKIPG
jgi:hypothetical protein